MLSAIKNYFLTFILSAVIFGLVASMAVGLVTDNINASLSSDDGGVKEGKVIDTGKKKKKDDEPGMSLNILLVGTDYRKSVFADYDPEVIEAMYPGSGEPGEEDTPYSPPDDLRAPAVTGSIISDSVFESGDGQKYGEDGLIFRNGFFSLKYRKIETDAILLIRLDKERGHISYTSFPTEAYTKVGEKYLPLREILNDYGIDVLREKVTAITGITVDRYALVSMEDFPGIIDSLGGISYYVPCNMQYDDYAGNVHINLTAGRQLLDGQKALQLLMFNNYTDGINSRSRTLVSFFEELMSVFAQPVNITKAEDFKKRVDGMFETDIVLSDFTSNIPLIFRYSSAPTEIPVSTKLEKYHGESVPFIDDVFTASAFINYRKVYNQ